MKKLFMGALVLSSVLLSACATIVGDDSQLVQVNSNPSGVDFTIKDETGVVVSRGITPQSVVLQKSDGSYFGKKNYDIIFCRDSEHITELPIKASANGWYIGGNIAFGGLIGWLAVDPFNGGMYTLKPKTANAVIAGGCNAQK
ncbi:hypothetical protein [Obesumbacterium proteus]|uniref:hypothetical protein n=1 Tax=Obesumbacterium proteus TaxID=82983 RepID=UPI003C6E044B